jgi:hypothetical protein
MIKGLRFLPSPLLLSNYVFILGPDFKTFGGQLSIMIIFVGFEVFTAVVMKSIIFWDITPCTACHLLTRWFAELFFDPEDGGDTFLRNVACNSMDYTASYPRR